VKRLLRDEGIVRNRLKIAAAIQNTKAFLTVRKEFGSFDAYLWSFVGGKRSPVNDYRLPKRGSSYHLTSGISKSHARVVAAGWLQRIPSDARMMKTHDRISLVTGPGEKWL